MADIIQFPGLEDETIEVLPWVVSTDQFGNTVPIRPLTDEERETYWDTVEELLELPITFEMEKEDG